VRRLGETLAVNGLLAAGAVLCAAPLLWMLSVSLMPAGEATAFPPALVPSEPTLAHYRELVTRLRLVRQAANSALLAALATAIGLATSSLAGYAFAKLRFAGRERLFRALLVGLVVPGQVAMLPLFLMLERMGLVNSYAGVLVPSLASIFGIFLVRQHMLQIPDSVLDAARLDGAGELRIWATIALPLSRPILVTLATFSFMGSWNDFLWPLIVLGDEERQTLPVALANLMGEHLADVELMMAGSVLTLLPVVLLFLAFQRHYVRGILAGSVRG
jgi:multiple sugar transport system permease protein